MTNYSCQLLRPRAPPFQKIMKNPLLSDRNGKTWNSRQVYHTYVHLSDRQARECFLKCLENDVFLQGSVFSNTFCEATTKVFSLFHITFHIRPTYHFICSLTCNGRLIHTFSVFWGLEDPQKLVNFLAFEVLLSQKSQKTNKLSN